MLSPSPKKDYSYKSIPEKYQKWAYLEGLIYDGRPENIEQANQIILQNNDFSQQSIYALLINAANIRPFSFQTYARLWISMPTKTMNFPSNLFTNYLVKRSLLPAECLFGRKYPDKTIEDYENVYSKDSLEYIISKDDLPSFLSFISSTDSNTTLKTLLSSPISYDTNNNMIDCMSLAALCGSKTIFSYLLDSNQRRATQMTIEYAIRGGNWDIIHQLVKLKYNLGIYLKTAIKYNHNSIVRYLLTKYHCEDVDLCFCASSFNTLATFFFLSNGASVYIKDANGQTPLMCAVGTGNLELVKLLIDYGSNINQSDQYGLTPLNEALSHSFTDIAQYLLSRGTNENIPLEVNITNTVNNDVFSPGKQYLDNLQYQIQEMDKQIKDLDDKFQEKQNELETQLKQQKEVMERLKSEKERIENSKTNEQETLFKMKAEYENLNQELIQTSAKTELLNEQITLLSKDIEQTHDLVELLPNDTQELYDIVVKMIRLKYSSSLTEKTQTKEQIEQEYNDVKEELNAVREVLNEIKKENTKFIKEINDLKMKMPPLIGQKKQCIAVLERNKNSQPKTQLDQLLISLRNEGKQQLKQEKQKFIKELKTLIAATSLKIQEKSTNQIKLNRLQAEFEEANERIDNLYNHYNTQRKMNHYFHRSGIQPH